MAKPCDIPGLEPEIPFREAASLVVAARSEEVWAHMDRALHMSDPEGVHDMRVATRRLRAALELFAPAFPKKRHREALREVKRLADALGERRDPDVMIERIRAAGAGLTREDSPGLAGLVGELRDRQGGANETLAEELAGIRKRRLPERIRLLAAEVRR